MQSFSNRGLRLAALGFALAVPASAQKATALNTEDNLAARQVWFDYDGDGLQDLYSVAAGRPDALLRNVGNGQFEDVTEKAGLAGQSSATARVQDIDKDRQAELLLVGKDGSLRLFQSSEGLFRDATAAFGLQGSYGAQRAEWLDYDEDGWLDLWLEDQAGQPIFLHNAEGLFQRVELGLPAPSAAPLGVVADDSSEGAAQASAPASASPRSSSDKNGRTPVNVSMSGLDGSEELGAPSPTIDDVAPIIGVSCAVSVANQTGSGCITAATTGGVVGRLLAQTQNLFVAANGRVGVATTNPLSGFHILNRNMRLDGNLIMGEDNDQIRFPAVSGASDPMISMFASGTTNANRMVLSHSPSFENYGLEYDDVDDSFNFQTSTAVNPLLEVDLGSGIVVQNGTSTHNGSTFLNGTTVQTGNMTVNGDISFNDDLDGITFSAASGSTTPMTTMFASGTANADRMVIAHSPGFSTWGLEYEDSGDIFKFQTSASAPTLEIDMGTGVNAFVPMTINYSSTTEGFDIINTVAGNAGRTMDVSRTQPSSLGNDILEIEAAVGSSTGSQLIEAQTGSDVEFRVDADGDVFADGAFFGGGADFAEMMAVSTGAASVEAGDVLVIDPANPRSVVRSWEARSTLVAGVYSTEPGFLGTEREWDVDAKSADGERKALKRADIEELYNEIPLAVVGIVPVKVSAENGAIRPGDLLVTSSIAGHAMRDEDPKAGTIVGKALGAHSSGTGVITMLVTLQ